MVLLYQKIQLHSARGAPYLSENWARMVIYINSKSESISWIITASESNELLSKITTNKDITKISRVGAVREDPKCHNQLAQRVPTERSVPRVCADPPNPLYWVIKIFLLSIIQIFWLYQTNWKVKISSYVDLERWNKRKNFYSKFVNILSVFVQLMLGNYVHGMKDIHDWYGSFM